MCFCPQTQIYLSLLLVSGSEHAYNMFILKHIKFCCVAQLLHIPTLTNEIHLYESSRKDTSDIIGSERIVSSDSPCDGEFIQKGIHLYFQEPIFSIYSQEDHVE